MDLQSRPRPQAGFFDRLLAIVGLAAFVVAGLLALRARAHAAEAREAVLAVEQDKRRSEERIRAAGAPAGEAERLAHRVALNAEAPVPRVLAELTRLMPEDVRLRSLSVRYADEVSLVAQVEAKGASAWDVFLDRLAASPHFARITPGPETRDGELRSSLRMVFRPEAP